MEKCKFNLKEQNRSVYCTKLEQWVNIKYCALCRNYEPSNLISDDGSPKLKCINKLMLLHSYSYNYSIANCINEGDRGNRTFLPNRFFIAFSGR